MMKRDSRPTPGSAIALAIPALLCCMVLFPHGVALSLRAAAPAAQEKPVRPNIVFILADDLGYGDLGCYGQQRIRTPEIDRLAAEGLRFVQFYAGSTVCAPSRCVLMTGRHTGHATVRGNSRDTSLRESELTVARLLQGAGYTTACIGKWGLGDPGSTGVPRRQGFDHFFGYLNHVHAHNYYPSHLWRNEERVPLQNRVPEEGAQGQGAADRRVDYSADLIAEEALGFIRRSREQPFFLYFAPTIPHANNEAREKGMEVPHHGEYAALDWPEAQKGHAAMISRLDRSVGRILSLLKELELDERTIVLFSSDNGPHKEGGADPRFNASSGPFRGLKRDLHEGGIRVPMIARWPGRIAAGKTSEHAGYFGDLLATAADLAGLPVPGGLDSLSFVPTLIGRGEQRRHDALYWEFHEGGFSQATLVEGRWKAVRKRRLDAPVEIYDLAADPAEAHDVAAQNAGRVAEARALFTSARTESPSWPIREAPVAAAPERNPEPAPRPNILWITCEDMGPHLGCYGSPDAVTPGLDAFAARSLRYLNVWSNAPVCAPARTAIISGLHPTSTGSEHMRSLVRLPDGFRMFPQLLRDAGYYCANNAKEDYNLEKPGQVWDDSSRRAHWRNRKPGQPFFAVFNLEITHESKIRSRPHTPVHDPARVRLPAYHPDVPEVRRDWAQYHDNVTAMDAQAVRIIEELEKDGLAGETIVLFFGDHGSGMPRSKRSACDSGLRVPLLLHVPDRFRGLAPKDYAAGGTTSRLVSFVDLAPAVLSLAGVKPPEWLQGRAFLGPHEAPPARLLFGFRGRMDERIDLVRCVTDGRFVYVRNYLPHRIAGQHVEYMFETPTTRAWKVLYDQGKLMPPRTAFWEPRQPEELYDLANDPDETRNLAASAEQLAPEHRAVLDDLRRAGREHALQVRDAGFLPEAEMHRKAGGAAVYDLAHDPARYPLERVLAMAEEASSRDPSSAKSLRGGLEDPDSAVRWWAATGCTVLGAEAVRSALVQLRSLLKDDSPSVRVAAAEALGRHGAEEDARAALETLGDLAPPDRNGLLVSVEALNAIESLGERAAPLFETIRTMPRTDPAQGERTRDYVERLVRSILREK